MIKVGIDAHYVGIRHGGNETFVENLVNALGRLDEGFEYHVYVSDADRAQNRIQDQPNIRLSRVRPRSVWIQRAISLPMAAYMDGVQVLHVPFIAPPFSSVPQIVTVHDVAFLRFPEFFDRLEQLRMRILVPASIRRARHVFAVSEFSKNEIVSLCGVSASKITVVHNGVDSKRFRPLPHRDVVEVLSRKYGLPERFVLYVGTIQPRKNLKGLFAAFEMLVKGDRFPHHLVVAGRSGWLLEDTMEAAEASSVRDRIHFIGPIPADDLPGLYNLAEVFAFPSFYEGFGLPPLEAMSCGTPVVVSSTASLPEIVGNAGVYVDPFSVSDIAEGLGRVLSNSDLSHELGRRGRQRAKDFTRDLSAKTARLAYQELIEEQAN